MTAFDDAFALILKSEGGKVDNKKDPGGRTAYGVTQRTFDAWQAVSHLPKRDVWTITMAEVAAIYRNGYFDPVKFEALPAGVGYCVVDEGINSGDRQAIIDLQRAVGVTADGSISAITLAAVAKADPVVLIGKLCDVRLSFMRRCKAKDGSLLWNVFGKGWSNRVAAGRAAALAMTRSKPLATPVPSASETSIAVTLQNSEISQVPAAKPAPATTGPAPVVAAANSGGLVACSRPDCPLRAAKAA